MPGLGDVAVLSLSARHVRPSQVALGRVMSWVNAEFGAAAATCSADSTSATFKYGMLTVGGIDRRGRLPPALRRRTRPGSPGFGPGSRPARGRASAPRRRWPEP